MVLRRWEVLVTMVWLAGLAGPVALPFFAETVRLDENALLPHQSAPTFRTGGSNLRPGFNLRSVLRDHGLPFSPAAGVDACDATTTVVKAGSNPQQQSLLWFVDATLLPLSLDLMLQLGGSKWLARDAIFVHLNASSASCDPSHAAAEWLRGYHETGDHADSGAGNVAAAIILSQGPGPKGGEADLAVRLNGDAGLLPNLDLVTTLRIVHGNAGGASIALAGMADCETAMCGPPQSPRDLARSTSCLWRFYQGHWMGRGDFPGGTFRSLAIDALELAVSPAASRGGRVTAHTLRSLELLSRSLNNVEEKLHHSTYAYLLFSLGCGASSPLAWIWCVVATAAPVALLPLLALWRESRSKGGSPSAGRVGLAMASVAVVCLACLYLFRDPLRAYTLCALAYPTAMLYHRISAAGGPKARQD